MTKAQNKKHITCQGEFFDKPESAEAMDWRCIRTSGSFRNRVGMDNGLSGWPESETSDRNDVDTHADGDNGVSIDRKAKASPSGTARKNMQGKHDCIRAESQRKRLLVFLEKHRSCTTEFARNVLRIYAPAARVCELRKLGYRIVTRMERHYAADGITHNMARYTLMKIPE